MSIMPSGAIAAYRRHNRHVGAAQWTRRDSPPLPRWIGLTFAVGVSAMLWSLIAWGVVSAL